MKRRSYVLVLGGALFIFLFFLSPAVTQKKTLLSEFSGNTACAGFVCPEPMGSMFMVSTDIPPEEARDVGGQVNVSTMIGHEKTLVWSFSFSKLEKLCYMRNGRRLDLPYYRIYPDNTKEYGPFFNNHLKKSVDYQVEVVFSKEIHKGVLFVEHEETSITIVDWYKKAFRKKGRTTSLLERL